MGMLPVHKLSKRCAHSDRGNLTGRNKSWNATWNVSNCPKYMLPMQSLKAMFTPNGVGTGRIGCSLRSSLFMHGKPRTFQPSAEQPSSAMKGIRMGSTGTKCSLEEKVSSSEKSCAGRSNQSRASDAAAGMSWYFRTTGSRMLVGLSCKCRRYSCKSHDNRRRPSSVNASPDGARSLASSTHSFGNWWSKPSSPHRSSHSFSSKPSPPVAATAAAAAASPGCGAQGLRGGRLGDDGVTPSPVGKTKTAQCLSMMPSLRRSSADLKNRKKGTGPFTKWNVFGRTGVSFCAS
mmetsp:Transcript_61781/g.179203  ORF Transcript_61781/g.179203 Transcript_61781/m.179203 type:complete len:290 (-) Transcript_61781:414-1283(-)